MIISWALVSYSAEVFKGWLVTEPLDFARRDGGLHLYFDQEVWPDQAGDHTGQGGRLMDAELAPDFDVGPDVLWAAFFLSSSSASSAATARSAGWSRYLPG